MAAKPEYRLNVLLEIRERKKEDAEVVFGNAIVLLILAALVLSMAGLAFLDPVLRIFGSSEAILPLTPAMTLSRFV